METRNDNIHLSFPAWSECAIILCDSNGLVSDWDARAEHYFGWPEAEAIGRPLLDLISPPSVETSSSPSLTPPLLSLFSQRGESQREIAVTRRDGAQFTAQIITRTSRLNGTRIVCVRGIARQEEKEGRESTPSSQKIINDILGFTIDPRLLGKQLEHILDYLFSIRRLHLLPKAGIFMVDQKSEKLILRIHRGFSDRHQKKCGEVPFGVCHCGKAAQLGSIQFSHCHATPSSICGQTEPHGHLCLPVRRDSLLIGIMCFYAVKGYVHSREDKELLESICHILGGIIETEEMDLQLINLVKDLQTSIINLRNEKKFSDSIIQGLNHGLLVVDLQGSILKSNTIAETILQPFASALDGLNLSDILGVEAAARMTGSCSSGEMENELDLITSNGEKKIISYTTVARDDAKGRQIGQIISFTDISEIKYVRKEMEKMNRLSTVAEIAAAVAHEVRNPLAGIKIMAQSIEEQSVTKEEQSECSKRIVRQVDRLNELLTEFFSYARPVTPKVRPISIIDILSETRHLIGNKLSNKHIVFKESHEQNLPFVMADPNQIQQVFLNLFLNAIDAIQQGGTIEVSTSKIGVSELNSYKRRYPGLLSGNHYISLRFSDNGAGMCPGTTEKVFEPFFTTKTTGSGLGLSIVYRTLKENGAAIVVESAEGKGTTFTIFFRIPA